MERIRDAFHAMDSQREQAAPRSYSPKYTGFVLRRMIAAESEQTTMYSPVIGISTGWAAEKSRATVKLLARGPGSAETGQGPFSRCHPRGWES